MTAAEDAIASSIFCSLVHATRHLTLEIEPGLQRHGLGSLTFMILAEAAVEPGSGPAALARRCGVSPQHLAGVLARAESDGLVERVGERGRGRATAVHVTAEGMRRLEASWPTLRDVARDRLTAAQHRQVRSLLGPLLARRSDPRDVVVLVDDDGRDCGTADRSQVHTTDTPLHRAFSTYLANSEGRVLLTRRALHKATWPGVWTNAACGHLRPGEGPLEAALRRVPDELGVEPTDLRLVMPGFAYRAVDASGIVENEVCPVMVGRIDPDRLAPHPDEIAEVAWVAWEDLRATARTQPMLLSPWSVLQVEALGDDPWAGIPASPATPGVAR